MLSPSLAGDSRSVAGVIPGVHEQLHRQDPRGEQDHVVVEDEEFTNERPSSPGRSRNCDRSDCVLPYASAPTS